MTSANGSDRKERRFAGFVIDNHLSAGSIITFFALVGTVTLFFGGLRSDIEKNAENISDNKARIERVERRFEKRTDQILTELRLILQKLDRKVDR